MWHATGVTSPITALLPAPDGDSAGTFAVAYTNGSIRLWDWNVATPSTEAVEVVTFNGHKKGVTTLAWDRDGSRLASGGTEGEVVVWDRIAEVGLFRLRGHRGPVTCINFIPHPTLSTTQHPGYLITTSRDTYLKLWDLSTQHCVQTVVVGRGEVWSAAIQEQNEEEEEEKGSWLILTGSGDGEVKAWTLGKEALAAGLKEDENGEVSNRMCASLISVAKTRASIVYRSPACFDTPRIATRVPSDTTAHLRADVGQDYRGIASTIRGGGRRQACAKEEA